MGFFGAVMNKLGEMVGEQVFPYYQNTALNMKAQDLRWKMVRTSFPIVRYIC